MNESDAYLFKVGNHGMLVVLALLFGRTAEGFAILLSDGVEGNQILTGIITLSTILGVLIGIIVTISFAHNELKIPYRPIHLLIALLLMTLPLFIAVECIKQALTLVNSTNDGLEGGLFKSGMYILIITFCANILYQSLIFFAKDKIPEAKTGYTTKRYVVLVIFNAFGILMSLSVALSPWPLAIVITSLVAVLGYLVFYWALQIEIRV